MVLIPLLGPPVRRAGVTHESITIGEIDRTLGTPSDASGITSVYADSGIGPGVPIPLREVVLSAGEKASLFSGGGLGEVPREALKITAVTLNNVAPTSKERKLYA